MQLPLEITYRNVRKDDNIESLIREKASRLEKFCDHITSCRIAVESPQEEQKAGSNFRVRIDITLPPNQEVVVSKEPGNQEMHEPLNAIIRKAFEVAERQLKEINERQRNEVKTHPQQEVNALIDRVYPDKDYGILKTLDGREIFFHKNSVVNEEFEQATPGTAVRYVETQGEKGPQATVVQITGKKAGGA